MFASTNVAYNEANCRQGPRLAIHPRIGQAGPQSRRSHISASAADAVVGRHRPLQQQQWPPPQPLPQPQPHPTPDPVASAWQLCRNRSDCFFMWLEGRRGCRLSRGRCPDLGLHGGVSVAQAAVSLYMTALMTAVEAAVSLPIPDLRNKLRAVVECARKVQEAISRKHQATRSALTVGEHPPTRYQMDMMNFQLAKALDALSNALFDVTLLHVA